MEYAEFGDHQTECFQEPGLAGCTNGVSVMVSVYLREHGDQVIANTATHGEMRGFAIHMLVRQFVCRFHLSDVEYFINAGFEASLDSTFINIVVFFLSHDRNYASSISCCGN